MRENHAQALGIRKEKIIRGSVFQSQHAPIQGMHADLECCIAPLNVMPPKAVYAFNALLTASLRLQLPCTSVIQSPMLTGNFAVRPVTLQQACTCEQVRALLPYDSSHTKAFFNARLPSWPVCITQSLLARAARKLCQ